MIIGTPAQSLDTTVPALPEAVTRRVQTPIGTSTIEDRRHSLTAAHLRRMPTGMFDISHDRWQDGRRGLIDDMQNLSERVQGPFWG
jgi:hypothetical protein